MVDLQAAANSLVIRFKVVDGNIDLKQAIESSDNIFFARIALALGAKKFEQGMQDLGIGEKSNSRGRHGGREHATSGPIRPIVSRITIHWPSFYNVVTGKTLALPNLIALQHIPLSPAGVIAKRPAPIALPNSCAA